MRVHENALLQPYIIVPLIIITYSDICLNDDNSVCHFLHGFGMGVVALQMSSESCSRAFSVRPVGRQSNPTRNQYSQ